MEELFPERVSSHFCAPDDPCPGWIADGQDQAERRKTQESEHPLGIGVDVKHHPHSASPHKKKKGGHQQDRPFSPMVSPREDGIHAGKDLSEENVQPGHDGQRPRDEDDPGRKSQSTVENADIAVGCERPHRDVGDKFHEVGYDEPEEGVEKPFSPLHPFPLHQNKAKGHDGRMDNQRAHPDDRRGAEVTGGK